MAPLYFLRVDSERIHRCVRVREQPRAWGIFGVAPLFADTPVVAWSAAQTTLVGVSGFLLGVAGWCIWLLYRDGAKTQEDTPESAGPDDADVDADRSATTPHPTSEGGLHRPVSSLTESTVEDAFFASSEFPPRRCPDCDRTFPGVFDVCPFDSTPLTEDSASSERSAVERLPRNFCPECSRRYELGASHCYHDGHALRRDTDRASQNAPTFHVCRSCGFDTRDALEECPRDSDPLIALDPMQRRRIKPAFPYNRCRQCGHVAPPDQTHCPTDGALMLPELSARLTALPPTGYGSRRRVCPDCGAPHGSECAHCSRDGTELIELN